MKTANLSDLVGRLGQPIGPVDTPDADLLDRFLAARDEEAFALLVRRYGPLILGVCRRVTGDHHLAEDAFQAVFVVLAAKAGSVRPRSALPAWLFGVARRVALRARTMSGRRSRHESPVVVLPDRAAPISDRAEVSDLAAVLDEEIARLPECQRAPVVACELDGLSRHEAAARLGISEGTLSSRLARARKALAARLRQRGVTLSAAGLTAAFAPLASGGVPRALASKAAAVATSPGTVPAAVAALSSVVLRVMLVQKLTATVLALAVVSGLLVTALCAADRPTAAGPPGPKPALPGAVPVGLDTVPKPTGGKPLPEGPNRLLVFRDRRLVLLDADGMNEKRVTESRDTGYGEARLAPDGKTVAVLVRSGAEGESYEISIRAPGEAEPGTNLDVACRAFAWSPDGSEIACAEFVEGPAGRITGIAHLIVDVKTKERKPLTLPDGHVLSDWSSDGKLFLTTRFAGDKARGREARLCLVNRDGPGHKALTDEYRVGVPGRLSPDGNRVLYGLVTPPTEADGPTGTELAVLDIPTGKSARVGDVPKNAQIMGFCWSPDGKRIAYSWRQTHEGRPEDVREKATESHLVVCDPGGRNAKTVVRAKGSNPWAVTIGQLDWR